MNTSFGFLRFAIVATALAVVGGMTACTADPNDPGAMSGMGGANSGTGSTPGATGGAGGMAPAGTACTSPIAIPAASPGIANFDAYDGVSDIGKWSSPLGGDSTSGVLAGPFGYGDRANGFPETFEMAAGKDSTYALRIADTLAQNYGGGLGTWLSACLNATAFSGISVWVRGNSPMMGKSTLTLSMQETMPSTPAKTGDAIGTCPGDSTTCVHPTFAFDVTDTWTKVQAPWVAFTAGNAAGTSITPDGRNITQIQLAIALIWMPNTAGVYAPVPAPYELAVDTLTFY